MTSISSFHHVTLSVGDLARSVSWYERVLGMTKTADREGPGWTRALMRSPEGVVIGLTVHADASPHAAFDHRRVGLDHLSIACPDRAAVAAWSDRLDALDVVHGVIEDVPYGHVLTCRDPDDIPIEFFAPPTN